ncbi:MAG: YlqD family protein [Bacillota bacterium]|jgi:hypothetical protein
MAITIGRPVIVKAIVTDALKDDLLIDLQNALTRLEEDSHQFDFQGRKMVQDLEKTNPQRVAVFKQQLETERQKRQEAKQELLQKMQAVESLEVGQEVVHSTVQGFWDVEVGQNWEAIEKAEIVIKDGVVIEIRGQEK